MFGWRAIARVGLLGVLVVAPTARAQRTAANTGDRLTGFVLPVEPIQTGISLSALRAWAWTVQDTKRLLLTGGVRVHIGGYELRGDTAVVWINRIPSAQGLINQIAVYFDYVDSPASRSGLGVKGADVLMTGSARGSVDLNVARLEKRPPPSGRLRQAEQRLAAYLGGLLEQPLPPLADLPQIDQPLPASTPVPQPGNDVAPTPDAKPKQLELTGDAAATRPLFAPTGTVWFSWDELHVDTGEEENVITATGSIVVQYIADSGDERWSELTLKAERAVIFTEPGPLDTLLTAKVDADTLRGIYLEGNVVATAGNGEYTIRAPQVYYDMRTGQAIMLEAVLRTYSREHRVTLYARAQELRQIAANQWMANRARVSTSEFFTPHFAIGSRRMTVTQRPGPGDEDSTLFIEARDNTLEVEGVPLLYWPKFAGTLETIPLKNIEVGYQKSQGVRILTRWDPFGLTGVEKPAGVEATMLVDWFSDRGPAGGFDLTYKTATALGNIDLYYLHDRGVDRTSSGRDVEPPNEHRGLALWSHQQKLGEHWDFKADLAYISDETFITSWRDDHFYNRREYETYGYLRYTDEHTAFDILTKYNINDFISNSYLLASRAYQVQKLPELTYRRYGDSLFDDAVTYSGETRLGRVRFSFQQGTAAELGVRSGAFPFLMPGETIPEAFLRAGFPSKWITRFDTRHEFAVPLEAGPVKVVPYVVGRLTAYSDDFQQFSSDARDTRAFGAVGLRLNTLLQKIDNGVESQVLDLHRLRTIVEPRLTAWYGATSVPDGALPVYDEAVESIGGGSVLEVGLNTIFQTQRGGPGRWRSVDVLKVDASVVLNSTDANKESPTPQFFDYRPEYSQFGDHIFGTFAWELSDQLALVGEATYDLDDTKLVRGSIGVSLQHTPLLATFAEYRLIEADDTRLLELGWAYTMSTKYRFTLVPQWDFVAEDLRAISFGVIRTFPDFDLTVRVRRDEIADETTFGASLDLVEF